MNDTIRLLGRTGGYTGSRRRALPNEPEAVDADTQARISMRRTQLRIVQRHHRGQQPFDRRLRRAQAQAKLEHVDVRPQLLALRRAMDAGRSHASLERRLQAIEQRVYREAA